MDIIQFKEAPAGTRQRLRGGDDEVEIYLNGLIERILGHRGVDHPFLREFAAHGLPPEKERIVFSECYFFFRHLPFYIAEMSANTRDANVLRELLLNVQDEIGGREDHPVTHQMIFDEFLRSIGISAQDIADYAPLPTSTAINEGIHRLYTQPDIVRGLGGLYADETMSSVMVSRLNDGLKARGRTPEQRHFFTLHMQVEVGHSNSVFNAIFDDIHGDDARGRFERGIGEFLDLLEKYWDGVAQRVATTAARA